MWQKQMHIETLVHQYQFLSQNSMLLISRNNATSLQFFATTGSPARQSIWDYRTLWLIRTNIQTSCALARKELRFVQPT